MEITKIFSYGSEKLYSVLLTEKELSLFSAVGKAKIAERALKKTNKDLWQISKAERGLPSSSPSRMNYDNLPGGVSKTKAYLLGKGRSNVNNPIIKSRIDRRQEIQDDIVGTLSKNKGSFERRVIKDHPGLSANSYLSQKGDKNIFSKQRNS